MRDRDPKCPHGPMVANASPGANESCSKPQVLSAWDAGDRNKVKNFVDSGGNINARDRDQWTCLHRAAFRDQVEAVRNLLEFGADPDLPVLPGGSKRTVDIVRSNNNPNAGQIASLLTNGGRL